MFLKNKNINNADGYLQDCNFVKYNFKKQEFKKHFHSNYSIGLITKGTHILTLEKDNLVVTQNEIKIVNPYDLHIANGNITWEYINFMPSQKIIKNIASDMCDDTIECEIRFKNHIKDSNATKYFINLFNSLNSNMQYEENFIIFIAYLLKYYAFVKLDIKNIPNNIQKSVEYIHQYCLEAISLEVLANISNLSKYHFIKVFKSKTGLTPYQYILDLRIEYALTLIKKKMPLSLVALECGFSDQSHFIRTFKKYYGFTPRYLI